MGLSTYPNSGLNAISDKLKSYLKERELKAGEIAKYRLLNGAKNVDPNRRKGNDYLYPAATCIAGEERIIDPGTNQPVRIGVVRMFDRITGNATFSKYYATPSAGSRGVFTIHANIPNEAEFYELLELSNANASNPYRDPSMLALFERVDEVKESRARSNRRNYLQMSLTSIGKWGDKETRTMAAAYNLPTGQSKEALKDQLESIAEKSPEAFYKSIDDEDMQLGALVRLGVEHGVISFNPVENKWTYSESGETAAVLDRREGVDEFEGMKIFLKSSANGSVVKGQIQKLLREATKEKTSNE